MKAFTHLIQERQEVGHCHHCGGCVAFCVANYGALELGEDGRPRYHDKEKCIECGICYSICPEINELDGETKNLVSWTAPWDESWEPLLPRLKTRGSGPGAPTAGW